MRNPFDQCPVDVEGADQGDASHARGHGQQGQRRVAAPLKAYRYCSRTLALLVCLTGSPGRLISLLARVFLAFPKSFHTT